jgi:multicomponent Na+:H+ antiporter subunit C
MTMEMFLGLYNYWIVIFLMMTGFYIVIARENLIKTVIGLNIFQTSVFLLYITMGKVKGGTAPILSREEAARMSHGHHGDHAEHAGTHAEAGIDHVPETAEHAADHAHEAVEQASEIIYSNPIPSVLMLTAIVVGIATTALALALIVRIREDYGTIEEDEILEIDRRS